MAIVVKIAIVEARISNPRTIVSNRFRARNCGVMRVYTAKNTAAAKASDAAVTSHGLPKNGTNVAAKFSSTNVAIPARSAPVPIARPW